MISKYSASRSRSRTGVRVVSVLCALVIMAVYTLLLKQAKAPHLNTAANTQRRGVTNLYALPQVPLKTSELKSESQIILNSSNKVLVSQRHLLSLDDYDGNYDDGYYGTMTPPPLGDDDDDNCTAPRDDHNGYNDSCEFVQDQCQGEASLVNYLSFVLCDLGNIQVLGYILLGLWLLYLISLLATTADNFFVPPLNLLSEKLRLSPSIAGITLLAIGNGAPDVFTAYAALQKDDIQLLLGALIGASIFISTVVLGTIILITTLTKDDIDRIDFVRDVSAYMIAVALVIGVAYDGDVRVWEAVLFPTFYFIYIFIAVVIAYARSHWGKFRKQTSDDYPTETSPLLHSEINKSPEEEENDEELIAKITASLKEKKEEKERLTLLGLTWPRGSHIGVKVQWFVEWPFSLLRWLSVPPCYYDGQWSQWHHWFVVSSPVPMMMVLLIAAVGWSGFTDYWIGALPLYAFLIIFGIVISVVLFFIVKSDRPPHWTLQCVLGALAFIMSIAWLNIEANEVVAVLQAFGLLFGIDTAILGLTVLAIGNSVGDWVADTAVARAGKPGMGIASCFGSPLLNDVLGLSVALLARMITNGGKTYTFDIHSRPFDRVKLSWIFLGISLVASAIIFPLFKFAPPKPYGVALLYFYFVFMVFSVLDQAGVMTIHFAS